MNAGDRLGLGAELLALPALGAVAAAGDAQRQRARGMAEAEMQRGEAAHRQADDVRLVDLQMIEHGRDVVRGAGLRIASRRPPARPTADSRAHCR